jgi:hypothetical protein
MPKKLSAVTHAFLPPSQEVYIQGLKFLFESRANLKRETSVFCARHEAYSKKMFKHNTNFILFLFSEFSPFSFGCYFVQ